MNPQHLIELLDVVKAKNSIDQNSSWSNGSETYLRGIGLELGEVTEELKLDRQGYLEEELGDVFWDYLNLLLCLEQEGRINLSGYLNGLWISTVSVLKVFSQEKAGQRSKLFRKNVWSVSIRKSLTM